METNNTALFFVASYSLYLFFVLFFATKFLQKHFFEKSFVSWPDISFGPVNLWTVVPALEFYGSEEERHRLAWMGEVVVSPSFHQNMIENNPVYLIQSHILEGR